MNRGRTLPQQPRRFEFNNYLRIIQTKQKGGNRITIRPQRKIGQGEEMQGLPTLLPIEIYLIIT
jgi:hypothetical protein